MASRRADLGPEADPSSVGGLRGLAHGRLRWAFVSGDVRAIGPVVATRFSRILPWLLILAAAAFLAAFVSGEADRWIGHQSALLLVALLLAAAFALTLGSLGATGLLVWGPLAVVAYLLVRYPRDHPVITFDRLWVPALLAYILLSSPVGRSAGASRFVKLMLAVFVAAYGVRAFATSTSLSGPVETWIDSAVLPAILFVAASRYARDEQRTQKLALSMMIAGGLLGAVGVAQRIFGFELASLSGGERRYDEVIGTTRVSGPYSVPETYALALIVCLAATLYWLQSRGRPVYLWAGLIAALEIAGLAFTYFRAAWIGALLVIIAAFGLRPRRFQRIFAVTIVVAALAFAGTSQLGKSSQSFEARTTNTDNIYGRLATYEQGVQIFKSAPLTGVGVDQYAVAIQRETPVLFHGVRAVTTPHSSFVAVLAEQGLVGFVPFLLLGFGVWLLIRRLRAVALSHDDAILAAALAGAAAGYLIMSLTLTMLPYEPSNAFFAVLLGAGVARLDVRNARGAVARVARAEHTGGKKQ